MKTARPTLAIAMTVWLVRVTGFIVLIEPLLKHFPRHSRALDLPANWAGTSLHLSAILAVLIGMSLIYLAEQLHYRKRHAYILTMLLACIIVVIEIIHFHSLIPYLLASTVIITLMLERRHFTTQSDAVSMRRGLKLVGILLGVTLLYGTIGFTLMGQHFFGQAFDISSALSTTIQQLLSLGNVVNPISRAGMWFLGSIDLLGITSFVLIVGALFAPLRFYYHSTQAERNLARAILQKYGGSSEDYFKLWPNDKHYYFGQDHQSFLTYGLKRGIAIVLDGPSGRSEDFPQLIRDFTEFCRLNGWRWTILHAPASTSKLLTDTTHKKLFIGSEALIDVATFAATTVHNKHFRYIINKARRDHLSFELWQPPLSNAQLAQLQTISNEWLSQDGRHEYRFVMGYFDIDYLRDCPVGVAIQAGQPLAYANLIPSYDPTTASIDQMRTSKDTSPVVMHFLLAQLILEHTHSTVKSFNLGLAPLAQVLDKHPETISDSLLAILKTIAKPAYSFDGLAQFKQKFCPNWQKRYLYYDGRRGDLVRIGIALYELIRF